MYYSDQQANDPLPRPEPGRFGAANTGAYTYPFQIVFMSIFGFFVGMDLKSGGAGFFRTAFGVSSFWVWVWDFLGLFIMNAIGVSIAVGTYWRFTGRTFYEDRLGYARAGGQDVAFWSCFLPWVTTVLIFGLYVPAGWLGWARPFVIVFISGLVGYILTKQLTLRLYAISLRRWFLARR